LLLLLSSLFDTKQVLRSAQQRIAQEVYFFAGSLQTSIPPSARDPPEAETATDIERSAFKHTFACRQGTNGDGGTQKLLLTQLLFLYFRTVFSMQYLFHLRDNSPVGHCLSSTNNSSFSSFISSATMRRLGDHTTISLMLSLRAVFRVSALSLMVFGS